MSILHRNNTCAPTTTPPTHNYNSLVTRQITNGNKVTVSDFPFTWNNYTYISHIAYVNDGKQRPLILVWPNYAGEKQFDIDQAVFLAKCGYTGTFKKFLDPITQLILTRTNISFFYLNILSIVIIFIVILFSSSC